MMFDQGILAFSYWNVGRHAEAQDALRAVYALMTPGDDRFFGGIVHGARALMAERRGDLLRVLGDGERSLAGGAPAHCHFWYRREAMRALLAHGDWDGVLSQAAALAAVTRAEPVPWPEFEARRARALVAAGQGRPRPCRIDRVP